MEMILTWVKSLSEFFNISEDTSNTVHAHLSQAPLLYLINTCLHYQWNVMSLTPKIEENLGSEKQTGEGNGNTINDECVCIRQTQRRRGH